MTEYITCNKSNNESAYNKIITGGFSLRIAHKNDDESITFFYPVTVQFYNKVWTFKIENPQVILKIVRNAVDKIVFSEITGNATFFISQNPLNFKV